VYIEDDLIGRLDGLKFTSDASQGGLEAQALAAAAQKAVGPEVDRRLTSISSGTHQIFTLSDTGFIMWGGMAVGRIAPSGSVFTPDAELIGGELGQAPLRQMATDRMREFLQSAVISQLAPLKALKDLVAAEDTLAAAKGFGYILLENNGALERRDHLQTVRDLDQDARRQLRSVGVVFGHYNVSGVTSIPNEGDLASSGYTEQALSLAGYRAVGPRIIRFDILNRLSFLIRQAQDQFKATKTAEARGHKFQVMAEMLALLGSTYEDVQGVLTALGYKSETSETRLTKDPAAEAAAPEAVKAAAAPEGDAAAPAAEASATETAAPKAAPAKANSKKALVLYNHRVTDSEGVTTEVENLEYWHFPSRGQKGFKPGSRGKPAFKGKRGNTSFKGPKPRRDAPRNQKPPTQKQVENSPFAAKV